MFPRLLFYKSLKKLKKRIAVIFISENVLHLQKESIYKRMKRLISILLLGLSLLSIQGQEIIVSSFAYDETDRTATEESTKLMDQNGQLCALIKVKTKHSGFSFDVGSLGISKTLQKKEEIWVYVPEGVKRITISHQNFGILRDHDLGQMLRRGRTYVLNLSIEQTQYTNKGGIDIRSNPIAADIYIDGELVGQTPKLVTGLDERLHLCRLVLLGYLDYNSTISIHKGEVEQLSAELVPASRCTVSVGDTEFTMIAVEGGSFMMGATSEQLNPDNNELPVHEITLPSFCMAETEVTQKLWKTVMGNNPSRFEGDNRPVEQVSWNDCMVFIEKLNQLTGFQFRLPTEEEWEYAARGGNKSRGYRFSGSNTLIDVACYNKGSHLEVKSKSPNELGIYDMSGNVWEWCKSIFKSYSTGEQKVFPASSSDSEYVIRGGSWSNDMWGCRVSMRGKEKSDLKNTSLGLRLVSQSLPVQVAKTDKQRESANKSSNERTKANLYNSGNSNPDKTDLSLSQDLTIKVGEETFMMKYVEGGSFIMGNSDEEVDEKDRVYLGTPAHQVTLSSYYIGETEVTQALWYSVMGNNPSKDKGKRRPVTNVTWEDCQQFIEKLNKMTGKTFRLPTEAEWEYAARGGNKSHGYTYSGSNLLDDVAWYSKRRESCILHNVKSRQPNELGIYDMSGNVSEWCQDWYHDLYESSPQTDPSGPASGSERVIRGGSFLHPREDCIVIARKHLNPKKKMNDMGFRLAL